MTGPHPTPHPTPFDYRLPPDRIAQQPAEPRDAARLLFSGTQEIADHHFRDLPTLLRPGDLLLLNDTRVIPARLQGKKTTGGRVELLLLRPEPEPHLWQALARANKPVRPGLEIIIAPGFRALITARIGDQCHVRLQADDPTAALATHGQMPLPPYITPTDAARDKTRYQTVFAHHDGAVAAPTAGLHFTQSLLTHLAKMGVEIATVTLHVGLGTFQPLRCADPSQHVMHREWCQITPETADRVNATRKQGGRIVAVGTTTARVLETAAKSVGIVPFAGDTALFIQPGHRFHAVDALITNFHLPNSTLLMLVAAFIGKKRLHRDYTHAISNGYRFYSYGDATLLLPEGR